MKFIRGVIHSGLVGTYHEVETVRRLLTFSKKEGSLLSPDNILYTGLIDFVEEMLSDMFEIEIEDAYDFKRMPIKDIHIPDDFIQFDDPSHVIRTYQKIAARKFIHRGRGIVEIATGGGKTEVAAIIIKYLLENNLIEGGKIFFVAGTRFLMKQAAARFEKRLPGVKICRYGGGYKYDPDATVYCCVIDSLRISVVDEKLGAPGDGVLHDFENAGCIFFEECHHLSALSWIDLGETCKAPYRCGLTATVWSDPFKYSHNDFFLIGLTGGLVCHIPSSVLRQQGYLAHPVTTMIQINGPAVGGTSWDVIYDGGVVRHVPRNSVALSLGKCLYDGGYKTLLFVRDINHGLLYCKQLVEAGCPNVCFVKGGEIMYTWKPSGRWEKTRVDVEELAERVKDQEKCLVVGNTVLDEGVDIPSFNALIMVTAMMKYRRTVQRAGRGMRPKEGDNRVFIFDFVDAHNDALLKHSVYRKSTYELEEFEFSETLEETEKKMGIKLDPFSLEFKYEWVRPGRRERVRKPRRKRRRKRSE